MNASFILINSAKDINEQDVLQQLGLHDLQYIGTTIGENAICPDDNTIFIGRYKGNWLICSEELPFTCLQKNVSPIEKVLASLFPDTEICALVLQSTINLWGYAVSKNHKKIRIRLGSSVHGTSLDDGNPLAEEIPLLSKSEIDTTGKRIYIFDEFPDEPLEEDQVGENFVFEVAKRYLGTPLDEAEDLLFETELRGYTYQRATKNKLLKNKLGRPLVYVLITIIIAYWLRYIKVV